MTITMDSDKEGIVDAIEMIISYAIYNQYIVLAQSVWWISANIGLQQGLLIHIDYLRVRSDIWKATITPAQPVKQEFLNTQGTKSPEIGVNSRHIYPSQFEALPKSDTEYSDSAEESISTSGTDIHNQVIEN
jgi:hypothetical protein